MRRDEEAAREREQAEEQRLQEIDAERRLAILRGEVPPPLPPVDDYVTHNDRKEGHHHTREDARSYGGERKKRKRHGEDDTDFEMRVAQDRASGSAQYQGEDLSSKPVIPHKSSDAPLIDATGHFNLFGGPATSTRDTRKNAEAEAEKEHKKREYEDQFRMRFEHAAGFKASASGPWYAPASGHSHKGADGVATIEEGKDAFGRPDPGRKIRDAVRIEASDPLAMMKKGAAKIREVEKERRSANEEREKEIRRMRRDERRKEKRRHRRDEQDGDEIDRLEGFSLDQPVHSGKQRRSPHSSRDEESQRRGQHQHHDHRHRSPHRSSRSRNQRYE